MVDGALPVSSQSGQGSDRLHEDVPQAEIDRFEFAQFLTDKIVRSAHGTCDR